MRGDMAKLLVERPRGGWRGGRARTKLRGIRDLDLLPGQLSIARDNPRTKYLSENLAPLKRLLERRVGQPWDRVYAEIRAHIRFEDPIQLHVLQHLWHIVELHVVIVDGIPYRRDRRERALSGYGRSFYVCPQSGVLRRVPAYGPRPGPQAEAEAEAQAQVVPPAKRMRKRNGSRR